MQVSNFENDIRLFRNAKPVVDTVLDMHSKNARELVRVKVEDVEHIFPASSRISQALKQHTIEEIADRFQGGTLFTQGKQLVDFRYNTYNGIVHDDKYIGAMIQHVGSERKADMMVSARKPLEAHFAPGMLGDGGMFKLNIDFQWSPFMTHISSAIGALRLACMNGLMVNSSILSYNVPVINRFEEHLDIATYMLGNRATNHFERRLSDMVNRPADALTLRQVRGHANERFNDSGIILTPDQKRILRGIDYMCDIGKHTALVATEDLDDLSAAHAANTPTHLSQYTAWNMMTEMLSHTPSVDGSSHNSLTVLANRLLFATEHRHVDQGRIQLSNHFNNPSAALMYHQI